MLDRENQRWQQVENQQNKVKERDEFSAVNQIMGAKRVANSNGYASAQQASPIIQSPWSTTATPKAKS